MLSNKSFDLHYSRLQLWQAHNPGKVRIVSRRSDEVAFFCMQSLSTLKKCWDNGKLTAGQLEMLDVFDVWRYRVEKWKNGKNRVAKRGFCFYYEKLKTWQRANPGATKLFDVRHDDVAKWCSTSLDALKVMWSKGDLNRVELEMLDDFDIWKARVKKWTEKREDGDKRGFCLYYGRVKRWQNNNPGKTVVMGRGDDKVARLCSMSLSELKRLLDNGVLSEAQLGMLNEFDVWCARLDKWKMDRDDE